MRSIEFAPLGRQLPQIGLGCGRLDGRASLKQSARLIEAALELGIRYFDVAPLYGMGTAEEALGKVLHRVPDTVIASKVGIPRPPYQPLRAIARSALKPAFDRALPLKRLAMRFLKREPPRAMMAPFPFTKESIARSVEESLVLLRRDRLDVLLAHDPILEFLGESERDAFATVVQSGLASTFGIGIDIQAAPSVCEGFGSIWQSKWPGISKASQYQTGRALVFHGVIRGGTAGVGTPSRVHPREVLRDALDRMPTAMIIVAASTPKRLKELVSM